MDDAEPFAYKVKKGRILINTGEWLVHYLVLVVSRDKRVSRPKMRLKTGLLLDSSIVIMCGRFGCHLGDSSLVSVRALTCHNFAGENKILVVVS